MKYLPTLTIPVSINASFPDKHVKEFLIHLKTNRDLLLQGPPHANEHTIDKERAAVWVTKQKTVERQHLASILLENLRYIPHSELLTALQICVQKAKAQLIEGPVIFIVGYPHKSNYYISLLFAHFWLAEGLPIDYVLHNFNDLDTLRGNYLDIDDMAYSGSQTETVLSMNFRQYCKTIQQKMKEILGSDPDYNMTYMFIPRYLVEDTLRRSGFRYILVRAFMSEHSFQYLTNETNNNWNAPRFPFQVVTSEIIQYMPNVEETIRKKIEYLFNNPVYSTVYFDHKVADMPSTYLLPIALGIIPERMIYINHAIEAINPSLVNNIQGDGIEFYPFLQHCSTDREFPKNRKNLFRNEIQNSYRCPSAWYKKINYNSGTYKKGGRRKRKTRRSILKK
jgi:hypothetical protein